jgi:hypothetical protein
MDYFVFLFSNISNITSTNGRNRKQVVEVLKYTIFSRKKTKIIIAK